MYINFKDIYLYEWAELHYIELEIQIAMDAFKTLIRNQEESFMTTRKNFEEVVNKDTTLKNLDPEDQGNYYSQIFETEEMTIRELQRQQRYAICLSAFSFFESQLKSICKKIENTYNYKIKIDDLNSNDDLMRYWNYLEKVFEVDLMKTEPYFTCIKQQKIVRNIIAHQGGYLSQEKKGKINIVHGLKLQLEGNNLKVEISDTSFILYLLDKMNKVFQELLQAVDKRYKELGN